MDSAPQPDAPKTSGEIIDFDEALLEACPADLRAQLIIEASLLAQAFAPDRSADQLLALADQLSGGIRDAEMSRARARRLAAAMRHLARGADA
jgi:hypothetical protein